MEEENCCCVEHKVKKNIPYFISPAKLAMDKVLTIQYMITFTAYTPKFPYFVSIQGQLIPRYKEDLEDSPHKYFILSAGASALL